MLDPTMMSTQMQPTPAAVPTPVMPTKKDMRVPLSALPHGTKEGDEVSLTVSAVDPSTGMVTLVSAPSEEAPADPNHDHMDESDEENSDEAPEGPSMDTKTLLGPMDGLKNYLVQKSMDVPKNQGR